jgi:hypothetical protein
MPRRAVPGADRVRRALGWLERVPTYKEQQETLKDKDLSSIGFLGYPLLQTADVTMYDARFVPVGDDQVAHLELSREIVRRFNNFFGDVLVEPQPLLTPVSRLPLPSPDHSQKPIPRRRPSRGRVRRRRLTRNGRQARH